MATAVSSNEDQAPSPQATAKPPIDVKSGPANDPKEAESPSAESQIEAKDCSAAKSGKRGSNARDSKNSNSSKQGRKRTKTGCLTCRRRRIKCGEERPTCSNCVKSKRNCEGYTPRVIFKDPLGAYRPSGGAAHDSGSQFQPIATHNGLDAQHRQLQPRNVSQVSLPAIAPQPVLHEHQAWAGMASFPLMPPYQDEQQPRPFDGSVYTQGDLAPQMLQRVPQRNCSLDTSPVTPQTDRFGIDQIRMSSQPHHPHHPDRDSGIDVSYPGLSSEWSYNSTSSVGVPAPYHQVSISHGSPVSDAHGRNRAYSVAEGVHPRRRASIQSASWLKEAEHEQFWASGLPPDVRSRYGSTQGFTPAPHDPGQAKFESRGYGNLNGVQVPSVVGSRYNDVTPPRHEAISRYDPTVPTHYDPSLDTAEDDYFDVTSDEEDVDADVPMSDVPPSNMGLMLALSANQTGRGFRSLTNFLNEPNVLASYRPSWSASPLMDAQTARVFCHFITATAPTLSLHNRHPTNPSVMFTGTPVPAFQRSLFTYTLPMMALTNQGLLHAQLALASLHIAKLQQTSPTPSLKHYHYALRRVAKAVGHPTKRREIATLAATLLLGFFEVTTAEHNKWNSHLAGARELLLEIDFAGMTKRIKAYKTEMNTTKKSSMYNYGHDAHYDSQRRMSFDILRTDNDLDEHLISVLMGYRTRYDEYGQVLDASEPPSNYHLPLAPKDVENFEIQCDLYWWYAKQDMYQSLISGNRLL
ncbi:MAG: hypothetical protein Q9207_001880 [Kuettlingeria erythrocarpa]